MNNEIRQLRGVVIDPGHGGADSGAVGNNQYEKDYSLKISRYMYDRFNELGIPVMLTRDSDITLSPSERTRKIIDAYGDSPDVIVISNHLNSGGGTGAEVIYALRNDDTLASLILENIGKTGQSLRRVYQRRLPSDNNKDYYFIHRNTGSTEPVIVEYGFIDDASNIKFLNDNYKELAEAVIKAVADYKGYNYVPIDQTLIYVVKKGDTLYGIANKYDTTVDEIKKLNNLDSNVLSIGQQLLIPTVEVITDSYVVKRGDTLYGIANKYKTTVDEIKKLNNLDSNNLSIGQVLLLPTIETEQNTTTYTVKVGDTLYSIAREFNTTVDVLRDYNTLTSNILSIGQRLQIPTSQTVYTVNSGDTLYSISKKFNTSVDNIKKANNLDSNNLSIGQQLIIK